MSYYMDALTNACKQIAYVPFKGGRINDRIRKIEKSINFKVLSF